MSSKLTNKSKVQVVSLKLDKTKARELAFREFLDMNDKNGINRKESILRMFENMMEGVFIYNDVKVNQVEQKSLQVDNSLGTLRMEDLNSKNIKWDEI